MLPVRSMVDPAVVIRVAHLRDDDLELALDLIAVHPFHRVPTCFFKMKSVASGAELGAINLRLGSTPHLERYAGQIGYGVHEAYRGHHYAARSVVLLAPVARKFELDPLWITCDPENTASRRSLELAGAEFVEIVDVPADCGIRKFGGKLRKCRYRL